MKRILIVDDHQIVLEGLREALSERPDLEVVGEASDGLEAVKKVEMLHPDIVLMDIAMPHLNGIETTYQIKEINPDIKVIVFTLYSYREFLQPLLKAGISGFVLKQSPLSDLYIAIEVVKKGGSYFSEDVHGYLAEYVESVQSKEKSGPLRTSESARKDGFSTACRRTLGQRGSRALMHRRKNGRDV